MLFASFRLCFFSLVPSNVSECEDSFDYIGSTTHGSDLLQSGIPGKMIITLDTITSFALLDVSMLSFGLATYHLFESLPIAMIKPLTSTTYANLCLAMLPHAQALLIALLVAGAVCSMMGHGYLGISLYHAYLINSSIHLVKGGRLGLLPGVLFHSCRPSFRNTGVMFLDESS